MLVKTSVLAVLLLSSVHSFGQDLFKVAPYTLKHTNGHLLLNLQLSTDKKLIIEDDGRFTPSKIYKKDQHYQVELGLNECGTSKDLRIKDAESNSLLYANSFPQPTCTTAPSESEYTFGFISDTQQYTERHEAISKVIAYHHSIDPMMFLINGGDIVQHGSIESEWIEYFKGGVSYLTDIPQIAAIGNHDYKKNKDEELPRYFQKYLRWEGAMGNGNLFFEMPGFQLVIWNSNTPDLSKQEEKAMLKWLEEKMQMAQKTKTPFVFATHFPVYSSSLNRFTSFPVIKLRRKIAPLVEKYGVKLVLGGHTHMYERSFKDGVNYVVAGPAGGRPNKPTFKNPYVQKFDSSALTFTKIHYKNKSFKLETYNQDNALIDQLFVNY